ncbi:MAG: ABC transporter ATP-binding protein [Syntrophorhabdus sp.]
MNHEFSSRPRPTKEFLSRTLPYLRPHILSASGNIFFAFLTMAFYYVFPYVTQYIIDDVIGKKRIDALVPAAVCLAGTFFLSELCNALRIMVNTHFAQNVIYDMRRDVYARLQRLPVHFFDNRSSGDLMTRIIDDVASVHRVLIDGVERAVTIFLSVIVIFVILMMKNAMLAIVSLGPLAILAAGTLWYSLTAHRRFRTQREAIGAMNVMLMDNLQGIRHIKAFGREDHEHRHFRDHADTLRKSTIRVMKVWALYSPAMTFAGSSGIVLVLWLAGPMVVDGRLTLGELVGFLFYLTLFYQPVTRLDGLNQMFQAARAASDRVFDILDTADEYKEIHRPRNLETPVRGDVRYENVTFGYTGNGKALHNVSFHARPGDMIALVGPTGSGKSTIANLLPGFYEPDSGSIYIDSQDISGITLDSLRSLIGMVTQDSFLLNGTVRENILYGKLNATDDEMVAASIAANCHDFIMSLPDGYGSRVGERGVKLSVGEKQRISIARAILKDAPILILDEATASVDTVTERLIQEALSRLIMNRTSFVIAHRLSTIRHADQILVVNHGEIVERGRHEELILFGGMYAKLSLVQNLDMPDEDKILLLAQ